MTVLKLVPAAAVAVENLKALEITEVAARVRAEIKQLQQAGELPAGKVSVTCSRFANGQSLTVRCIDIVRNLHNVSRLWHEIAKPEGYYMDADYKALPADTELSIAVEAKLKAIVAKYHQDDSDSMADISNCNFYAHVYVQSSEQRRAEIARLKAAAGL